MLAGRVALHLAAGYFMLFGSAHADDSVTQKMRSDCRGFLYWEQHKALPRTASTFGSVKDQALRKRLLAMVGEDQDARTLITSHSPGEPKALRILAGGQLALCLLL